MGVLGLPSQYNSFYYVLSSAGYKLDLPMRSVKKFLLDTCQ
jgi:hypothetical protein